MNLFDGDPRIAIPQVISVFTRSQDHRRRDETLSVCTEDFRIRKGPREYDVGALRQLWQKWDASGLLVRHFRMGFHFTDLSDIEAKTIGYGLFYAVSGGGEALLVYHPAHFTEYHETFSRTADGWKLRYRHTIDIMRHETIPLPVADAKRPEALESCSGTISCTSKRAG
jgi:hypothetical protein